MSKEATFLNALQQLFVGTPVEGQSGFINLMAIKARYYQEGVFPHLMRDIEEALAPFPAFREELFDKLYTFFQRYFSESGSIYFRYTPLHQSVYEHVYRNDRDTMLFWKTHMLYYVKTDRLFQSMNVEVDNRRFYFDAAQLTHKRANEKRTLIYDYQGQQGDTLRFAVQYSERGRKTDGTAILRDLKKRGITLTEESLQQAFGLFERQSEVDFFINKEARSFLREQFDLWAYQYFFADDSQWSEERIRQLQALREIAYKIVDFIAQFEDELARIWNKPKFILDSHYVITLDRIAVRDMNLLARLLEHAGMGEQIAEWRELGMIGEDFKPDHIWHSEYRGERLHAQHQYLPLDTRHFPDQELDILALFDSLDAELDGWLINSENYQALNTLMPKFRGRVQAIYIDPPYNRPEQSEIPYLINYKRSSWLSLMENRLELARDYLREDGVLVAAIDDHEFSTLIELLRQVFHDHALYQVVVNHHPQGSSRANVAMTHEYMLFSVPSGKNLLRGLAKDGEEEHRPFMRSGSAENNFRYGRPNSFYAVLIDPVTSEVKGVEAPPQGSDYPRQPTEDGYVRIYPIGGDRSERVWRWSYESAARRLRKMEARKSRKGGFTLYHVVETAGKHSPLVSNWVDSRYNAGTHGTNLLSNLLPNSIFKYPKSIYTVMDAVNAVPSAAEDPLILDFFAGSGTTAHAVINLNREDGGQRKYILVEMAAYFDAVLLPRVKKIVYSDSWSDGKAQEGGLGSSHFLKYFRLEQYEDVLQRASYGQGDLFMNPFDDPYSSYIFRRDLKLMEDSVELDATGDAVQVHLDKLYEGIDVAETLSCLTGKAIRRITADTVEFEDGSTANLSQPDWEQIKRLLWW